MEPLFLFATLLQQPHPLGGCPVLDPGLFQGEVEQEGIHIIPAELRDPGAADHLVATSRHTDHGRIEGATTEIIHDDQFAPGAGSRTTGMMGIFDTRGGRLIEQPADLKAGAAEGLQRQEPLVAVGIGRDGDHGLQGLVGPEAQVRGGDEVVPQLRQEGREQLQGSHGAGAQRQRRRGSQRRQLPLEGAQECPAGVVLAARRVQPTEAGVTTHGDQGWIPVLRVALGGLKTDHRVVAPINSRHDGAGVP